VATLRAGGVTDAELAALDDGMAFSGKALLPTQMREELSSTALDFALPYFVVQGRDDMFTPTVAAEAYFAKVVAPRKQIEILDGAGHFALVTHAQQFAAILERLLGR
jgi:pimeloyl-ACP methyl ester carboxylesterase